MTTEQLIQYCKDHDIFVPGNPTKEYLCAAIVRIFHSEKRSDATSCFGFWQQEHSECMVCNYQGTCAEASIGMPVEKYFRSLKKSVGNLRMEN